MLYDMDCEPGHRECKEQVTYPDLKDYQAGSPHYEQLMSQLADAQRFTWPLHLTENV